MTNYAYLNDTFVSPESSGILAKIAHGFARFALGLELRAEADEERRGIRALLQLEDWQLDDMGVSRADIYGALDSRDAKSALELARCQNRTRALLPVQRHTDKV